MTDGALKVLYITGAGRSGSTVLGNLLGEADGFFHAGELRSIWWLGMQHGRLCGCGVPVARCDFWSSVLRSVLEDPAVPAADPGTVSRWHQEVVRVRYTLRFLRMAPGRPSGWTPLDAYMRVSTRLYRAIAEASGARVIVDSSKRHTDAAIVRLLPGIDPYFVHLVRDPRAVAYSWRRHKASPGEGDADEMPRYSATTSSRIWLTLNLGAELLRRRCGAGRFLTVRYRDFVEDPRRTLEAIAGMVGEPDVALPLVDDRTAELTRNHTAGGNPDRFRVGRVALHPDEEWQGQQPWPDRLVVTALTLPLLPRYGYPILPRPPRHGGPDARPRPSSTQGG